MRTIFAKRICRIILLGILAGATSCAPIGKPPSPRTYPPRHVPQDRTIGVVRVDGPNAFLNRRPVRDGQPLNNGDHVSTGPRSSTKVIFNRGGFVQLNEDTDPTFQEIIDAVNCIIHIVLHDGEIFAENDRTCNFEIQTRHAVVAQHSGVNINTSRRQTVVTVLRGNVTIPTATGRQVRLRRGEQAALQNRRLVGRRALGPSELRSVVRWRNRYSFIDRTRLPDLRGQHIQEARRRLHTMGLRIGNVTERPDVRRAPGTIISQRPNAGNLVRPGQSIDLVLAAVRWSRVPELRGLSPKQARERLNAANLKLGTVTKQTRRNVPPGTVFDQSQRPGQRIRSGQTVDLVVASVADARVPNIRGVSENRATEILRRSGLRVGKITRVRTNKYKSGVVIDHSPPPGRHVKPGSYVALTIARPAQPSQPNYVKTPNFYGLSVTAARRLAKDLNIEVRVVGRRVVASRVKPGYVIDQKPDSGKPVRRGARIDLWLQDTIK